MLLIFFTNLKMLSWSVRLLFKYNLLISTTQPDTELVILSIYKRKSTKGNYLQSQFIEEFKPFLARCLVSTSDVIMR